MERQFPKNVRQVGNVCDEPKIYMEDYVDTYLSQLRTKALEEPAAAALVGEITEHDGQAVVYISGAVQINEIEIKGAEVFIKDEARKDMEDKQKEYFPEQSIVGWCLIETGHPMGLTKGANKLHGKIFAKENSIFVWKDSAENEEMFFAYKFGELMQMGGHYIYYERNPAMQNYMISTRKKNGVTPCEMVEDRAAKNFRSAIREKAEYKEHRQSSRMLYVTSVLLIIVVLAIGVSAMNNYDKMESVQSSLESLSQSVNKAEESVPPKGEEPSAPAANPEAVSELEEEAAEDTESMEGAGSIEDEEGTEAAADVEVSAGNIPEAFATMEQLGDADFYIVKKGDTLDSISTDVYGDRNHVDAICKMNGLSDGNLIYIGQKLLLP